MQEAPGPAPLVSRNQFKDRFKQYFLTGIVVFVPVVVTFWVLKNVLDFVDSFFAGLPALLHPHTYLPIPGFGVLFTLVLILAVGALARSVFGSVAYDYGDRAMSSIPVLRSLYNAVKQTLTTFVSTNDNFRKVVLVEYPRKGIYALGFLTGAAQGEIQEITHKRVLHVFVPTSPNPTSGFLLIVPDDEVIPLKMSVEDAFKVIISGGMVNPSLDDDSRSMHLPPRRIKKPL
jgi:uncharacterized membrane protein